jgi:hypothetical protein
MGATGLQRVHLFLNGAADLLAHVVASGLDPNGVVGDPVHDRVGADVGAETPVPVRLQTLRAGHRRAAAALHELEQDAETLPGGAFRQRPIHRRQE